MKTDQETEFDAVLRQLTDFFYEKTNAIVERFTFRQRGQQQGESTAEYMSVLRGLSITCSFRDMEEEMIRDMVVKKKQFIPISGKSFCKIVP